MSVVPAAVARTDGPYIPPNTADRTNTPRTIRAPRLSPFMPASLSGHSIASFPNRFDTPPALLYHAHVEPFSGWDPDFCDYPLGRLESGFGFIAITCSAFPIWSSFSSLP